MSGQPFNPLSHPPRKVLLLSCFTEEETKAQRLRTPERNQSTQYLCTMSLNNNTHFQRAYWVPGKSQGFTFIPHKSHMVGVRKPIFQMGQLRLREGT